MAELGSAISLMLSDFGFGSFMILRVECFYLFLFYVDGRADFSRRHFVG